MHEQVGHHAAKTCSAICLRQVEAALVNRNARAFGVLRIEGDEGVGDLARSQPLGRHVGGVLSELRGSGSDRVREGQAD